MRSKMRIFLAICLSVLLLTTTTAPAFATSSDIKGHWAENVISKWVDNGWIKGYPDGTFGPDKLLLKADFIALANRSLSFSETTEIMALDASEEDWFFIDLEKAVAAGYLTVPETGLLKPESPATREEIAVMIAKMLKLDLNSEIYALGKFSDTLEISPENINAVNAVVEKGIMIGYGSSLGPRDFITRAQGVLILDRIQGMIDDGLIALLDQDEEVPGGGAAATMPTVAPSTTPGGGIVVAPVVPTVAPVIPTVAPVVPTVAPAVPTVAPVTPTVAPATPTPIPVPKTIYDYIRLDELSYILNGSDVAGFNAGFALLPYICWDNGIIVSLYDNNGVLLAEMTATQKLLDSIKWGTVQELDCPFMLPPTDGSSDYWTGSWGGPLNMPAKVVIRVAACSNSSQYHEADHVYLYDSQDVVYVDNKWGTHYEYDYIGANMLYGLNAFEDIQKGVTAVNSGGKVIVHSGTYDILPNDTTGHYGVAINKPMTLLGAQADTVPVENGNRGAETILVNGSSSYAGYGGAAITLLKNAGAVEIRGFTFMYNEIGLDLTAYDGAKADTGVNDDGIVIKNNRFIDNFIDVIVDNNDNMISNLSFLNNVFGMKQSQNVPFEIWPELRDIVKNMHDPLSNAAEQASGGSYLEIDLTIGLMFTNPVDVMFSGNTVYGKTIGVGVLNPTSATNKIYSNVFHGNSIGVGLLGTDGGTSNYSVDINMNLLTTNTIGVASLLTGKVNATHNWWGAVDWVDVKAQILSEVSMNDGSSMIEYFPWALNSGCTEFANDDLTGFVVNNSWEGMTTGKSITFDGMNYIIDVNAFPTIQGAIEAASENYISGVSSALTTINIVPGTYNEKLIIPIPMTVQKLAGYSGDPVILGDDVLIQSDNVTFRDVNLAYGKNIEIYAYNDVTVLGNTLNHAPIIFYCVPAIINGIANEYLSENDIGAANNGAEVRFAANDIMSFYVKDQIGDTIFDNANHAIYFVLPYSEYPDYTQSPLITVSPKATFTPESGLVQNFISPVIYDVKAGDGTTQPWTVYALVEAPITSYVVAGQTGTSEINPVYHTVVFHMPFTYMVDDLTDVTLTLTPSITASGATYIEPDTDESVNFVIDHTTRMGSVNYLVASANTQAWTVTCIIDKNTENDILGFTVPGQEGNAIFDYENHLVEFRLPGVSDLSALVPVIVVSPKAVPSPTWGATVDFSSQLVTYTITAQDGTTQDWDVYCNTQSALNDITSFSVTDQVGASIIDANTKTVEFHMLYGTDVTALQPSIGISLFAAIYPASLEVKDFSLPVTYTVTAQDGTAQNWTVNCIVDPDLTLVSEPEPTPVPAPEEESLPAPEDPLPAPEEEPSPAPEEEPSPAPEDPLLTPAPEDPSLTPAPEDPSPTPAEESSPTPAEEEPEQTPPEVAV